MIAHIILTLLTVLIIAAVLDLAARRRRAIDRQLKALQQIHAIMASFYGLGEDEPK